MSKFDLDSVKKYYDKPKRLFQYRSINEYTMSQLKSYDIYGCIPRDFNDPFDCSIYLNEKRIKSLLDDNFPIEKFDGLENSDEVRSYFLNEIYKKFASETHNMFKYEFAISCFTEKNDNTTMWAHYADNNKGFVLEYDFDLLNDCVRKSYDEYEAMYIELASLLYDISKIDTSRIIRGQILPISYCNYNYDFTDDFIRILEIILPIIKQSFSRDVSLIEVSDSLIENYDYYSKNHQEFFLKTLLHKQETWSYEKEWRCWNFNINKINNVDSSYCKITSCKPSSIFLGINISEDNKQELIAFAKEKNIDIYEMRKVTVGNILKLHPFKI